MRIPSQNSGSGVDRAGSVFRMYVGGNAIVTWYVAMTDPRSLMYLVASTRDGAILIWALMAVGAIAVLDAVINDFLPDRFHWRVALRQRHYILVAMAFCYIAQLYVEFNSLRSGGLLAYYLWNALTIMLVAFIDAHQRSQDAQQCAICN